VKQMFFSGPTIGKLIILDDAYIAINAANPIMAII